VRIAGTAQVFVRRGPPPGSKPGEFVLPSDGHPTRIRALVCDAERCHERPVKDADDLARVAAEPGVTWIDVQGLGDGTILVWLRDALGVHPLAVADIANTPQRPKYEDYGDRDLIVCQQAWIGDDGVELEQVSLVTGPGWVVSVQESPGEVFDPVRERVETGAHICRMGADFLAYSLIDAVIDGYFPVIEQVGEVLDELEEEITAKPGHSALRRLHAVRRTLLALHRSMWRQRDALGHMLRSDGAPFSEAVRVYVRDAYDHALQVLDTVETYRDMCVSLMDVYLSSVSNRLSEVMKTLTVMASIFIPLTFIVGVYGMNFEHMPELRWRYGYPGIWIVIVAVSLALLWWFRRRGWLERETLEDNEGSRP
jgi:magnesium transporter